MNRVAGAPCVRFGSKPTDLPITVLYEKLIQVVLPAALIVSGCVSLSSQGQGVVVADTEDEEIQS